MGLSGQNFSRGMAKFGAILLIIFIFVSPPLTHAATTPNLGQSASFGILSNTYTNTVGGTTINGDLGYTTGPASPSTVNGTTHIADGTYTQAGIDQGSALSALNLQPCDFNFGSATDLSLISQPLTPGVYCITANTSIGTGGITLSGSGTYLFRIDGALTTVANSAVTLAGGASACNVFWTPTAATTLGATSTFFGTIIDNSGITIGTTVTWTGRALAFGGTVSTTVDTITAPTCTSSTGSSSSGSTSGTGGSSTFIPSPPVTSFVAPSVVESSRVDGDSIFISWSPYSGTDTFNVRYGFTKGEWLFNTNVTGFSTTINGLPSNRPIWVQVAARNNSAIGIYGEPKQVGGPILPAAGIGPKKSSIPWYIPAAIFLFSLFHPMILNI